METLERPRSGADSIFRRRNHHCYRWRNRHQSCRAIDDGLVDIQLDRSVFHARLLDAGCARHHSPPADGSKIGRSSRPNHRERGSPVFDPGRRALGAAMASRIRAYATRRGIRCVSCVCGRSASYSADTRRGTTNIGSICVSNSSELSENSPRRERRSHESSGSQSLTPLHQPYSRRIYRRRGRWNLPQDRERVRVCDCNAAA